MLCLNKTSSVKKYLHSFLSQKQSLNKAFSELNAASPHVAWHVMCFSLGGDPGPDILEGR